MAESVGNGDARPRLKYRGAHVPRATYGSALSYKILIPWQTASANTANVEETNCLAWYMRTL